MNSRPRKRPDAQRLKRWLISCRDAACRVSRRVQKRRGKPRLYDIYSYPGLEGDERAVEVLGRFFVGQVGYALECHQTGIAEIPAQRLGGMKIHGAVFRSADEESGVIANLGKRSFQFREVCRPIPDDVRGMTEAVILLHGYAIARERIGRNFRAVAEQTAQPWVVEGAPAFERAAEEQGAKSTAQKRREPLAMRRPGIDGRHQHQAPQAGVGWPNKVLFRTDSCHPDGDATAVGSTQQVEIFDTERVRELEDALGGGTYGAVHALSSCRQPGAQIVDGINGRMGRQCGDGKSPGKRISHKPMNEDERRARPGLEVAHASAGEFEPVLFNLHVRCNSKPRRARARLALGGRDEFFSEILRFDGQRNPHSQRLNKGYRLYP